MLNGFGRKRSFLRLFSFTACEPSFRYQRLSSLLKSIISFQSVSGETDIEKCLAVLESMDWNLVGALERFMTDQDAEIGASAEVSDVNTDRHSTGDSNIAQSPSKDGQTSPLRAQSPEISADSARASSSFAAEPSSPVLGKKIRLINFEVFYNNQKYPLAMMDEHTVGK